MINVTEKKRKKHRIDFQCKKGDLVESICKHNENTKITSKRIKPEIDLKKIGERFAGIKYIT